jgi:valyl-tRNA synthetase
VKPAFGQSMDRAVYDRTIYFFEQLIQLLHPFMPFITEELYHLLRDRSDDLCVKQFSSIEKLENNQASNIAAEQSKQIIQKIREFRNKTGKKRDEIVMVYRENTENFPPEIFDPMLAIANAQISMVTIDEKENEAGSNLNVEAILIGTNKLFLDLGNLGQAFTGAIKNQLVSELERLKDFLASVNKKLSNERFVQNAKAEVIDNERKKKEDTEIKINAIEESLSKMN